MLSVSVVIATYAPGGGLDRLIDSIDAQTMPSDRFEVIFVDDGSPDDTVRRLERIAATRPFVRVERIENSGWASRPRNVGTDLARGEYVLFMDHDDALYPDALRAGYEWASRHGADVLNGKEARTHDPAWAIDTYRADRGQDTGRTDQHPLVPMNPHKLYRTAFLREHGIRFPEGRRVLWEDIFFNVLVARYATTISTLSSVPFYHWVQTKGSGSTTFLRSDPEWWNHLARVLDSIERNLGSDTLQGRQLLRHQYGTRILGSFNPAFVNRPDAEQALIIGRASAMQEKYFPPSEDESLDRGRSVVARALRSADIQLLRIAASGAGTDRFAPGVLRSARWIDGSLELDVTTTTAPRLDDGGTFHVAGDLVTAYRREEFGSAFSDSDLDVREELVGTTAEVVVRGRNSRIAWPIAGSGPSGRITSSGPASARFEIGVRASITVDRAALGAPLTSEVWDVTMRTDRAGRIQQPRVRSAIAPLPAILDGRVAIAYTNRDGFLSIDLDEHVASVFDSATPRAVVGAESTDGRVTVTLDLGPIPTFGTRPATGSVPLRFRRRGLRSSVVGAARRLTRREHPPRRFDVVYASGTGSVTATLSLPDEAGRYSWSPSERRPEAPAWSLGLGTTGDVRLEGAREH